MFPFPCSIALPPGADEGPPPRSVRAIFVFTQGNRLSDTTCLMLVFYMKVANNVTNYDDP